MNTTTNSPRPVTSYPAKGSARRKARGGQLPAAPQEQATVTKLPVKFGPAPVVGIVIPIFRHSVVLVEAIESILDQDADFPIHVALVNDGCPFKETDLVCREYARSYPDRITYLAKPNGGLSDARNHGIRYLLNRFETIEAVYMLDADNRLRPNAMRNAKAALDANPEAGWIYPNIDMFGLQHARDYGGEYSLLIHTLINTCEAGSLISRKVFDAGVYFDTSFKSGFEDWDFFITAAEAGFRGVNIENFGFLYRKRAESMLADSERDAAAITHAMMQKHKKLYKPRSLIELEQKELPRYAILLADRREVMLTTDPDCADAQYVSVEEFERLWWTTLTGSSQYHVPPLLVVTHSDVIEQLRRARVLHSTFWTMEERLSRDIFVALEIEPREAQRLEWGEADAQWNATLNASMIMVRPGIIQEVMKDTSIAWISGIAARPCSLPARLLRLQMPEKLVDPKMVIYHRAANDLLELATHFQASNYREALKYQWDWRIPGIEPRQQAHMITRKALNTAASYPRLAQEGRELGIVIPLVEFGGVERVALNMAKAMKAEGWRPHLFILEAEGCQFSDEWRETFESITFLADKNFSIWGASEQNYIGTTIPHWSVGGERSLALSMLSWLDLVINFHGGAISGVMGQLKRFGVKTALSLHLSDLSEFNRAVGNTYLGLAFEHAYDMFLPCSEQLSDWCHAMGVPDAKIISVPNAPSFELPAASAVSISKRRETRAPDEPLKVIYLGRLDHQKGLSRLIDIIEQTKSEQLPIEWRLIGKAVMANDKSGIPHSIAEMIQPVLTTPEELAEAYEWADAFILPSYYEGLPLTILEAMRSGAIPIASNVGAVSEVVSNWKNGVLLPQDDAVGYAISALRKLSTDPQLVLDLAAKARADMQTRNWATVMKPVLARVEELLAQPEPKDKKQPAPPVRKVS